MRGVLLGERFQRRLGYEMFAAFEHAAREPPQKKSERFLLSGAILKSDSYHDARFYPMPSHLSFPTVMRRLMWYVAGAALPERSTPPSAGGTPLAVRVSWEKPNGEKPNGTALNFSVPK
jgi:hypothetical protein